MKIHVLYAEDDETVIRFMGDHFAGNESEFELEIVRSGAACLERMREGGVDVLLLDLVLPDIDGLEVLGELAVRGDATPVVMVSGQGQTELAVKALRAGAADCVDKASPLFAQIVQIVRRLHAKRQAEGIKGARGGREERRRRVLLVETSSERAGAIRRALVGGFPLVDLHVLGSPSIPNEEIASAEAVVIGPNPGGDPLEILRSLRSRIDDLPVILIAPGEETETAVAAFKLGAQDYLIEDKAYMADLAFSLGNALRRGELARQNTVLSRELEAINRSLEAQVDARTRELEALSMRFISVREEERRAIARELHDEIGQVLTGLKLQLEAAAAEARPSVRSKLAEALKTSATLLERARDMTLRLRPLVLDDLGLKAAIEWHLNVFHRQTGITVDSDVSVPEGRLPETLETTIFRIVQEALTNVARHSGASSAGVTVCSANHQVVVEISDRGSGFDVESAKTRRNSIGLVGLAERARLAGGSLEVTSQPGRGTRVNAVFALPIARTLP
ncbi:MAG TPA: response regulator [Opitutaceae bacterium]